MIFWGNIVINSNLQKGRILKSRRFNDKKDQHVEMDLIFNSIFQKL